MAKIVNRNDGKKMGYKKSTKKRKDFSCLKTKQKNLIGEIMCKFFSISKNGKWISI